LALSSSVRLRPNSAEVAAKVMDGEAIIINLSNGMYYSMDRVGGLVWELVERGQSLAEMVTVVTGAYQVEADLAGPDLERLLDELLEEKLIVDANGYPADDRPLPTAAGKLPYSTPALNKYSDMGDLLALDPPMPNAQEFPWQQPGA
jgi:coenzyme PQQ synthesis protein D (PqqD)